ncbi:sensor histidine kinase [Stackebrandtia nassauensis]|uniref:histidine kinase n=1 Tax=Stackebrandtia nassauensis (strain DSM 44728 / CIP 108903 / NRRL B-16338 / NBRC 102104 / LLR-40K-21) TaxID=446470 RepID=D3PXG8_STANL|nr:ATP-binding protein [Stackebrandtia nassauensis]ADD41431.1 histidine kinase [Stackebrandtia nassauensis DSM 44728]
MRTWRPVLAGAGTLALIFGVLVLPADPWLFMVAPTLGCLVTAALMASWPLSRAWVPLASGLVGAVSLGVTAVMTALRLGAGEPSPVAPTSLWLMLEPAVLLIFVYLPVRWSRPSAAVWTGGAAGLGVALNVQRYITDTSFGERVAASALWMIFAVATGTVAWYLRSLAEARGRAIAEARQTQRLELAADLHDFVAHDVSEIVAQAQAGRMVLAPDPRLAEVLERIEVAGLRALASMDRTVHMLRETDGATVAAPGVLADLDELVSRFESAGTTAARLDNGFTGSAPREIAAVAYRVVVEALTNVRRHAATATRVTVALAERDDHLVVTVTDDGRGETTASDRTSAGTGLAGLSERVTALGGDLTTATIRPHGWRLTARLPLTEGT